MTTLVRQCIGIDIGKDQFVACIASLDKDFAVVLKSTKSFSNTVAGFEKMKKWVSHFVNDAVPVGYVMEATGVYYESLAYWLDEQSKVVSVILPKQFKAYANSVNAKSKTDKIDARLLAQMGLERSLAPWKPVSEQMRELKQLCRERNTLKEEKKGIKNQLHALSHSHEPNESVKKRFQKRIELIEQQIQEVESAIKAALEKDSSLKERVDNVCTIKGVGLITAVVIIAETNGFALFQNKGQLVCYAGYDVVRNESGSSVRSPTKMSKKGNSHIRKALHYPALSAARFIPRMKKTYENIVEKTKIKMKGSVAIQRRLLVLIYTLFRNNTVFQTDYPSTKAA